MIKAIFFDVDGTLLSHETGEIPKSTKRSLQKLKENGIKIFMSTGRHMTELKEFPFDEIEFDGYVTLNGQLVLGDKKQMLCSNPLPKESADELVRIFNDKKIPIILVEEPHIYINFVNELVEKVQREISSPIPEILEYDGRPIFQASTCLRRGEESCLEGKLPKGCKLTRWSDGGADIIAENGGKVEGIKKILKHFHILQDEVMAFGDAENDMEMLEFAKVGIAMGNATQGVKDIADDITDHIDEDGIEKALVRYGLIEI